MRTMYVAIFMCDTSYVRIRSFTPQGAATSHDAHNAREVPPVDYGII